MSKQKAEGIAYYEDVNDNYLKRRRLQGNASSALLWSLALFNHSKQRVFKIEVDTTIGKQVCQLRDLLNPQSDL